MVLGKCYRSWNILQITEEGLDFPSIHDVSVFRGGSVDDGDRAGVEAILLRWRWTCRFRDVHFHQQPGTEGPPSPGRGLIETLQPAPP